MNENSGLEKFGFVLPPYKARGPEKMAKNWTEVHRAGPTAFEILSHTKNGITKRTVTMEAVQECWEVIRGFASAAKDAGHKGTVDLTPRQIIAQLLKRAPAGTPTHMLSPDEAQGGVNRAAFYMPSYYYPMVVLDQFYHAVERSGRSVRVMTEDVQW